MLKLGKLTDYATVVLSEMAKQPETTRTKLALAQTTGLNQATVSKVLKLLVKAQVLTSTRGIRGGYTLARSPEKITLASIILALEGSIALTECSASHKNCHQVSACHIQGHWGLVNQKIQHVLESFTLADMILPIKPPVEFTIPVTRLYR